MLPFNLFTATAYELLELLEAGKTTSTEIVETYLSQINKNNHRLKAVISTARTDLLFREAKQLDVERKAGDLRGPLHGIPTLVKACGVDDFEFRYTVIDERFRIISRLTRT